MRFRVGRPILSPFVLQEVLDNGGYDKLIPVSGADGVALAIKLAAREGILTGIWGSSSFAIARQIAERPEPGSVILAMLPDTGERYLSRPTSTSRCPTRRRHNRGGKPLRKRQDPVQTNRTTSMKWNRMIRHATAPWAGRT